MRPASLSPEEYVGALATLVASPGWKLLEAWAKAQREMVVTAIQASSDPNALLKSSGVLQGIAEVLSQPSREIAAYRRK